MSKINATLRWFLLACIPFAAAGALGAAGCGLDDTANIIALAGVDSGADVSIFDGGSQDATPTDSSTTGACASNPCENGGSCADDGAGGFTCTCAAGYSGTTCTTNINDCATADGGNVCLNGGTCTDGVASFSCSCPVGFTGTNCQTNVNDCSANPCIHGTCIDGVNSYSCTCAAGFAGGNCDTCATNYYSYPTCTFCQASTTCNGHGTCSAAGTCTCGTGFTGASCNACATDYYGYPTCTFCQAATTCSGHGTCSATGSCTCGTGFAGASCNACATNYYSYPTCTFCDPAVTCGGHGTCSGTGTCQCNSGYSGTNCGTFSGTYSGSAAMPSTNGPADTVAQYGQVNGTAAFSTNTNNNRFTPGVNTTLKKLTFGPTSGDIGNRNWVATVMKNGTATALTCTINTNGTTCNITVDVPLNTTDAINIKVQQDQNTNTDRTAGWSIDYTQP